MRGRGAEDIELAWCAAYVSGFDVLEHSGGELRLPRASGKLGFWGGDVAGRGSM